MSGRHSPRSRKETRAAVLEALLRSKRLYRQELAVGTDLTEASISRILGELRHEGLVAEERVAAPYVGGPGSIVTLGKDVSVLGIELSNERLSFGIGDLAGRVDYTDRHPAPIGMGQDEFEQLFRAGLSAAARWADGNGRRLRQAAMSLPGLRGAAAERDARNVILPWDMGRLRRFLSAMLGEVPLALANTVIAQAAFHRYSDNDAYPEEGDHLLVLVGNGVAGVVVQEGAAFDVFQPCELGHVVVERGGASCRCGHRGCVEAYTSLRAVSAVVGMPAREILRRGDGFLSGQTIDAGQRAALRRALRVAGAGIGTALTLTRVPAVVVSGWPSLMAPEDRAELLAGIDETLLGGIGALRVGFIAPSIGADPRAAVAYAAHALARAGGRAETFSLVQPEAVP